MNSNQSSSEYTSTLNIMEIEPDFLVYNFTSIGATFLVFIITIIVVIQHLKNRWPISANCWFCNNNTKIYRSQIDWWLCPSCSQYNGFTENGDYKFDIPEQRKGNINSRKFYRKIIKQKPINNSNGLCHSCNRNQELKTYELSTINTNAWMESEITALKKNMEIKYALCNKCNNMVKKFLKKQSSWLAQYKMLSFKRSSIKIFKNSSAKMEKLCRFFLILLSLASFNYTTYQSLPIAGAILQLFIGTKLSIAKRNVDLIMALMWMALVILMPFSESKFFKLKCEATWSSLEYITGQHILSVLSLILTFMNVTVKSSAASSSNISFKRLDSPSINLLIPKISADLSTDDEIEVEKTPHQAPVNVTQFLTTPFLQEPTSNTSSILESQPSPQSTKNTNLSERFESLFKQSLNQRHHFENDIIDDGLKTLRSLSLSDNIQQRELKRSKMFKKRTYSTRSPELFNRHGKMNIQKSILAPPKLKNIAQTSWVAGGYWQMGMEPPSLSRSSSQSSGFGSASSNCGPSREPSVINDVDRCSVISDVPTQCCHSLHPPRISPISLFGQQSGCRLSGHELNGCMANLVTPCVTSPPPSVCHSYYRNDQYLQNQNVNLIHRNSEVTAGTSPLMAFLTNPWLPVFFCGTFFIHIIFFSQLFQR